MHFTAFIIPFMIFVVMGLILPVALSSQAMANRIDNH
jgi:hypothetical protein